VPSTAAWIDTGFLVALFARDDRYHVSATHWLKQHPEIRFHTLWPVIVEAAFFLDVPGKAAMLLWLERGAATVHELYLADLPAIRATLERYSNLSPDFTDAALVTLAGRTGIRGIVTTDLRDFSAYRLPGGKAFERHWL
jgi:predicted nucleic acid-binding protein